MDDGDLKKLAHDLRTPLSVLMGYVSFMRDRVKDQDEIDYLKAVSGSIACIESVAEALCDESHTPLATKPALS